MREYQTPEEKADKDRERLLAERAERVRRFEESKKAQVPEVDKGAAEREYFRRVNRGEPQRVVITGIDASAQMSIAMAVVLGLVIFGVLAFGLGVIFATFCGKLLKG